MKSQLCPKIEELSFFRAGALGLDRHLAVAKHVKKCSQCRHTLATIPSPHDDTPVTELSSQTTIVAGSDGTAESGPLRTRIGPYLLRNILGRGGMGVVYEAEHEKLKNRVALKLLPRATLSDPTTLLRFQREWEAVGRLQHPNVARALHADEIDGVPFLAMELVKGPDFGKVIHRCGALSAADAAEVIRQAALGLGHAHSQGVIHRDVKPSNLLLNDDGIVKLLDLGLARFVTTNSDTRLSGTHYLGTADYMAPEQWDGHKADPRSDLYSLGCVLFFLLTGKAPFSAPDFPSPRSKMRAHHDAPIPVVPAPAGLAEILKKMMAKKPEDRPASATSVADQLSIFAATSDLERLTVTASIDTVGAYIDGEATSPIPNLPPSESALPKPSSGLRRFLDVFKRNRPQSP